MESPIVLLHGFTQTGASWRPVERSLADHAAARGERPPVILAPDLRGHGSAAAARPVDLASVLDDLDPLVDAGATLGGYSMGGRLALAYAVARPGWVGALVLVGASPGIEDPAERAQRRAADEALAARIEAGGTEAFAAEWEAQPLFAGQPAAVVAAARRERLGQSPAGLAAALRGLGTGALPSLWDSLEHVNARVTLVAGEFDQKFRTIATAMAERLAHADVVVFPGAGHAAHLEAPESMVSLLTQ